MRSHFRSLQLSLDTLLGLYGSRRRPDGYGTWRHEHIWAKIVRKAPNLSYNGTVLMNVSSEDELHQELRFTGAGILAMANSGADTNGTLVL